MPHRNTVAEACHTPKPTCPCAGAKSPSDRRGRPGHHIATVTATHYNALQHTTTWRTRQVFLVDAKSVGTLASPYGFRVNRGVRGSSGAKAPPLAARPNARTHETTCPSAGVTRHTKCPAEKHRCRGHHIATVTATHCNTLPTCCNMHKHDPTCPSAGVKRYRCTKSPSTSRASSSEKCCPKQLRGPLINGKYAHGSTPGPSPVCGDVVSAIPNLHVAHTFKSAHHEHTQTNPPLYSVCSSVRCGVLW